MEVTEKLETKKNLTDEETGKLLSSVVAYVYYSLEKTIGVITNMLVSSKDIQMRVVLSKEKNYLTNIKRTIDMILLHEENQDVKN